MLVPHGSNLSRVKASNQASILQAVYRFGPVKRSDIARRLELTLPTITTNISAMISAGLVRETDEPEAASGFPGRRPRPVDIVPEARHFAGVELQDSCLTACIVDFRGRALASGREEVPCLDYGRNLELACGLLRRTAEHCGLGLSRLDGICFSLPGLVDSEAGALRFRPGFGWRDKDLCADAAARTGYPGPIRLENSACARACGAQLFRRSLPDSVRTFAYLFISNSIECPLMCSAAGPPGPVAGAGAAGHMVVEPGGLLCGCGNRGCLEAYAGDHAVLSACRAAMEAGCAPGLRALRPGPEGLTMADVLSAQAAGDPRVSAVVERAVRALGAAAANILNFACPPVLLVDGALFRAERNRSLLLEAAEANVYPALRPGVQLVFAEPDEYAGAMGAAARAISRSLESAAPLAE